MPLADNIYYYIVYGLILLAFFMVLKAPKKSHKKTGKNEKEEQKED